MNHQDSSCEAFELASLRRTRGAALAEGERALLDSHLIGCAACRDFAAAAEAGAQALRLAVRRATDGHDWDGVRGRFMARERRDRRTKLVGLGSVLFLATVAWICLGPRGGIVFGALALGLLGLCYRQFVLPHQRRARAVAALESEMLDFYRADLDLEIHGLQGGRQVLFVIGLLNVLNLLFMLGKLGLAVLQKAPWPDLESHLGTFLAFLVVGGAMWLRGRAVLPRLLRERAELSR